MRWGSDGGRCPVAPAHAIAAWGSGTPCSRGVTTTPATVYMQAHPQSAAWQQSGAGVFDVSGAAGAATGASNGTGAEAA